MVGGVIAVFVLDGGWGYSSIWSRVHFEWRVGL